MKFSGTTVEDAAAIRRVSQLVKRRLRHRPVVIVSALARVTDELLHAGRLAADGKLSAGHEITERLRQRHEAVAHDLVDKEHYDSLWNEIEPGFERLDDLLEAIATAKLLAPAMQDRLVSMGEWFSSKILQAALARTALDVTWVDATACIVTDEVHTQAMPLWPETNRRLEEILLPLLQCGQIPVLGGFVGATREGAPTTLGRGGSNFTASIVGAGLQATRIEIWANVDGVMTTDPKLCPDARRVTRLSFGEAAQLAHLGVQALHPAMLAPAMQSNIPVWVLNSRDLQSGGTEITAKISDGGRVKAIAVRSNLTSVDVEPLSWLGQALLPRILEAFERRQHSLELFTAACGGFSLIVNSAVDLPAIAEELKDLARVRWEKQKALICLVGEKIRRRPELASQALHAISDIDLRLMCQGASERSIGFLVDESRAQEAVQRLHDLLFPEPVRPANERSSAAFHLQGGTC